MKKLFILFVAAAMLAVSLIGSFSGYAAQRLMKQSRLTQNLRTTL